MNTAGSSFLSPRTRRTAYAMAAALCLALAVGGVPRLTARSRAAAQTALLSKPTVSVVTPSHAPATQALILPGEIEAYQEARIYARTSGYLRRWYTDIGTHVQAGELLAKIESPEVDAELAQARSDAAMALANYQIAKVTADRWQNMLKHNAVSRQSAQENVSLMKAKLATLAAARANVMRLQQLQSFENVYAPFHGVITVRNIDTGALIDAGNGGSPAALFALAETDRLRVFVNVPQEDTAEVAPGTPAELALPQFPGRFFSGRVARTSGAIDPASRTLRVEVDLDNPGDVLMPGAFAQVTLMMHSAHPGLTLPASTLLFRPQGVQVAVVGAHDIVHLRTVALGRDFGVRVEIRSGLRGDERVVLNPGDAISAGQAVRVNRHPATPV